MCLIFDCCFSGGLISRKNNFQSEFKKGLSDEITKKEINQCDVNSTNRIVIMSTLNNCLGDGSALIFYAYESPLMASLAVSFDYVAKDDYNDGYISVEEAFNEARQSNILKINSFLILFWLDTYKLKQVYGDGFIMFLS